MRKAHPAVMTTLLLLISGVGCATVPRNANLPLVYGGPGETLKRLTTLMQTPSEPRQATVPNTGIPAPSSMGDGGPGAYYKHLLTLMETPAVKHQVVTSRALAPAPFAAEEPSKAGSIPSPEPPQAVPSTPPATAMAPLPPPAKSEEVVQPPPLAVLPLPPKEEARTREHTPPPASRMETAAINLGVQTPPPLDSLGSKEERLLSEKLYRIGSEDVLRVSVWENPELTMDNVTVRPDGKISLPLIKEIHAADLTPMELSDVITRNLNEYMKDPHVTVTVTQINSKKIYLVGNVLRPGSYPLLRDMTVLQALSLAGGFTTFASPRNMKIISGTGPRQKIREINYYKMIEDVGLGSYMLTSGDTIVIP